jgi:hypothetical protein
VIVVSYSKLCNAIIFSLWIFLQVCTFHHKSLYVHTWCITCMCMTFLYTCYGLRSFTNQPSFFIFLWKDFALLQKKLYIFCYKFNDYLGGKITKNQNFLIFFRKFSMIPSKYCKKFGKKEEGAFFFLFQTPTSSWGWINPLYKGTPKYTKKNSS